MFAGKSGLTRAPFGTGKLSGIANELPGLYSPNITIKDCDIAE